ncbi:dipeptide epimerase [Fretibacter rubidus]|uniref:dipeptide epimerase n=1 Tax=Fretibacter rubidus TaxID=570162 RepID=UPI00352A71A9
MREINSTIEHWPVAGTFRISRSSLTEVIVVTVAITDGVHTGYGECRPYARYNETAHGVCAQINSLSDKLESLSTETLQDFLPAGAARNAVDCALWDLKAQQTGQSVAQMLNLLPSKTSRTAFTLSIDTPAKMQTAAIKAKIHSLLKIKIGDYDGGLAAALAIFKARPDAELIIDANEALSFEQTRAMRDRLAGYPVVLIEQPVPSSETSAFDAADMLPIICADESLHTRTELPALHKAGYRAVNVKLDKTGGLTEAVKLIQTARAQGFVIMIGCMVGTSLAMAPATLLMDYADVVDLDGALLLAKDRNPGIHYHGEFIDPAPNALWGQPRGALRLI